MADQDTKEAQPLSVYDALMAIVDQMASIAWQKMGLQPDVMTGKIETNFDEAKIAIDVTASLVGYIETQLDETDKREVHNLVRNLRLNYVLKSKESSGD